MAETIVVNTGPLIALAHAGALDVMSRLEIDFVCPREVREELDHGATEGHPHIQPSWLRVVSLRLPVDPIAAAVLDRGEAAVIQLARDISCGMVCLDERKARTLAVAIGLRVVGSLGLLLRAKRTGTIPAIGPYLDRLRTAGDWFAEDLIRRVLDAAGE